MDAQTEKATKLAEETAADLIEVLPDPVADIVPYDAADAAQKAEIDRRVAELDMTNTQTIIKFGTGAQQELTALSDQMLDGVRNKDLGPAGDSLRNMVGTIRGFDTSELDPGAKKSWWQRIFGGGAAIHDFVAKYEGVLGQIDTITDELLDHEKTLLKDVKMLDKLYERSLEFYNELGPYSTLAQRQSTGSMAFWIALILGVILLFHFV